MQLNFVTLVERKAYRSGLPAMPRVLFQLLPQKSTQIDRPGSCESDRRQKSWDFPATQMAHGSISLTECFRKSEVVSADHSETANKRNFKQINKQQTKSNNNKQKQQIKQSNQTFKQTFLQTNQTNKQNSLERQLRQRKSRHFFGHGGHCRGPQGVTIKRRCVGVRCEVSGGENSGGTERRGQIWEL